MWLCLWATRPKSAKNRDRTDDLLVFSQALDQLSYLGKVHPGGIWTHMPKPGSAFSGQRVYQFRHFGSQLRETDLNR